MINLTADQWLMVQVACDTTPAKATIMGELYKWLALAARHNAMCVSHANDRVASEAELRACEPKPVPFLK